MESFQAIYKLGKTFQYSRETGGIVLAQYSSFASAALCWLHSASCSRPDVSQEYKCTSPRIQNPESPSSSSQTATAPLMPSLPHVCEKHGSTQGATPSVSQCKCDSLTTRFQEVTLALCTRAVQLYMQGDRRDASLPTARIRKSQSCNGNATPGYLDGFRNLLSKITPFQQRVLPRQQSFVLPMLHRTSLTERIRPKGEPQINL